MPAKTSPIDAILARLEPTQRAALEKVRRAIRAAAPAAEECVSYGLAAFRLNGKPIAGLGASASHCSYFPMSGSVVATLAADLKGYDTSKGAIRFPADRPLPATLVRKLIKARIAEITLDAGQTDPAVTAFLAKLEHPLKKDLTAIRKVVLGVSPTIRDGIKWNSLSFRTTEYFATVNLRSRERLQLVFHLGAKRRDNTKKLSIPDPAGLVKWLATDRCLVTLGNGKQTAANRKAFAAIVREWIKHV